MSLRFIAEVAQGMGTDSIAHVLSILKAQYHTLTEDEQCQYDEFMADMKDAINPSAR
jgi:nitrate/nitrite-specific signal transduction histidine kinase